MKDHLNFHDEKTLYVLRKDGHYDVIYKGNELIPDLDKLKDCDKAFNNKLNLVNA